MKLGPVAVLVCVLAILVAPAGFADPNPSQRITAECNPKLLHNMTQRVRLLQLTRKNLPRERAREMALDELLNEAILQDLTQRAGIRISNQQVDEAYASIAERIKLTPKNLSSALRQSGVKPKTLKIRLRTVMSWHQLVAFMQDGTGGTLTEKQIIRMLREKIGELRDERYEAVERAYRECR